MVRVVRRAKEIIRRGMKRVGTKQRTSPLSTVSFVSMATLLITLECHPINSRFCVYDLVVSTGAAWAFFGRAHGASSISGLTLRIRNRWKRGLCRYGRLLHSPEMPLEVFDVGVVFVAPRRNQRGIRSDFQFGDCKDETAGAGQMAVLVVVAASADTDANRRPAAKRWRPPKWSHDSAIDSGFRRRGSGLALHQLPWEPDPRHVVRSAQPLRKSCIVTPASSV